MGAETVVQNDCSRLGLRVVHVMRMGSPVEVDEWLGLVPGAAWETVRMYRRCEKALGVHHLYVTWKAREGVRLKILGGEPFEAVVWWVGKAPTPGSGQGPTLREAARAAAEEYWLRFDRVADTVWVRGVMGQRVDGLMGRSGEELRIEGYEGMLVVKEVEWGLKRFVIVGLSTDFEHGLHGLELKPEHGEEVVNE